MVLVDTSVWVDYLRVNNIELQALLIDNRVACHPFVVGELACGNLKRRSGMLSLIQTLPMTITAEHKEVMRFIERQCLMGKGLGYIDVHLLASAMLSNIPIWTLDEGLYREALAMRMAYPK